MGHLQVHLQHDSCPDACIHRGQAARRASACAHSLPSLSVLDTTYGHDSVRRTKVKLKQDLHWRWYLLRYPDGPRSLQAYVCRPR